MSRPYLLSMNRDRVWTMLGVAWLALLPAVAGDKAQTSGALRPEEGGGYRLQSEAERVGTMNKLLRNRQFDVFRAGNSLGGAIDVSLPTPSTGIPSLDPKAQQRLLEEYDRKKNWLAEPGSVKPREVDKSDRIESGKRAEADEIPNFSRERGRSRRSRNDDSQQVDFDDEESNAPSKPRKTSKLAAEDDRSEGSSVRNANSESLRRDGTLTDSAPSRSISDILSPEADHRTWFSGTKTESSGGTFSFNSPTARSGSGIGGAGADGFAGSTGPGTGSGLASPASANALINPAAPVGPMDGDPGRRFDPTVAPGSPIASPDAGFFSKSGVGASTSAADGGFGSFGNGGGVRGFENSARSLFTAPSSEASTTLRSVPSFTPRPAVLSFPQAGPF